MKIKYLHRCYFWMVQYDQGRRRFWLKFWKSLFDLIYLDDQLIVTPLFLMQQHSHIFWNQSQIRSLSKTLSSQPEENQQLGRRGWETTTSPQHWISGQASAWSCRRCEKTWAVRHFNARQWKYLYRHQQSEKGPVLQRSSICQRSSTHIYVRLAANQESCISGWPNLGSRGWLLWNGNTFSRSMEMGWYWHGLVTALEWSARNLECFENLEALRVQE